MSGCMETPGPEMMGEAALITKYVSCIRICGQPILPPVMTAARREEMRVYKAKAEQVERKLRHKVQSPKCDTHTGDVSEVIKPADTIKDNISFQKVDTHEILEEFDPYAPTAFSESAPGAKLRHSGSSDEFFVSKTDSSNNSVAMTNSTDLYHYMDISGSTLGDGRSTRRSLTPSSNPGTTTGGDWNSPPAYSEFTNHFDVDVDMDGVKTTYEGLNEYLDNILNSSGVTSSDRTESGRHNDEDATPTNVETHSTRRDSFADFQEQLNRREATRPASCPLSPTAQQSLLDSAIGSLGSEAQSLEKASCAEGKLIDLAKDPSACERKKDQGRGSSSNSDTTAPRLVRSNSYTLESPSPMLLAHLEAEKRKNETTKAFTSIKQPLKTVAATLKNKSVAEKPKNGVVAPKKNEGQARKDSVALKPRICHSPPKTGSTVPPVVTQNPSTALSPKNNKNRFTQAQKCSKAAPPLGNVSKTSPEKAVPQKDCADDVPAKVVFPDGDLVVNEHVRKLLTNLQAEHNRQVEELLARQRKEQELIRQTILRQKDLLTSDPSLLAAPQLSEAEAGSGENYTWASLLKNNSPDDNGGNKSPLNLPTDAAQSSDSRDRRVAPPSVKESHEPQKEETEACRKIVVSVVKGSNVDQNTTTADVTFSHQAALRSASGELIQIEKETSSVSRSMSTNFLFSHFSNKEANNNSSTVGSSASPFNSNTLYHTASMSETCIDLLHSDGMRNLNLVSNTGNRQSCPKSSTGNLSFAFNSACDDLLPQRKNGLATFLAADVTVGCLASKESESFQTNPFKDANGNLSQTNDLNCKNLLVSLDANQVEPAVAVNPSVSPAIHQVTREISLEDGVLTCYEEILSAEVYPTATSPSRGMETATATVSGREQPQIVAPTAEISPRGRRKAWNNRQAALEGTPEWLEFSRERQKHWAATKIQAAARGYLTRRLLRTERVQNCITVIHDTILCALQLQKECGRNVEPSDVQLHGRLIHQLSDACREIHSIFVDLPIAKRMAIISVDRERLRTRATPTPGKTNAPRPLSRATQIALSRKMANCQNNPVASGRRKSWANFDSSRSSRPSSSTYLPEGCETIPACLVRSSPSPAMEIQKSASAGSTRKPWR